MDQLEDNGCPILYLWIGLRSQSSEPYGITCWAKRRDARWLPHSFVPSLSKFEKDKLRLEWDFSESEAEVEVKKKTGCGNKKAVKIEFTEHEGGRVRRSRRRESLIQIWSTIHCHVTEWGHWVLGIKKNKIVLSSKYGKDVQESKDIYKRLSPMSTWWSDQNSRPRSFRYQQS